MPALCGPINLAKTEYFCNKQYHCFVGISEHSLSAQKSGDEV